MTSRKRTVALLKAAPGRSVELESLLRGMVIPSRSEPGNLGWELWQDESDPTTFVIVELYRDHAAVLAHRATPHYKNYASHIGDLASRTAVTSDPVDVAPTA